MQTGFANRISTASRVDGEADLQGEGQVAPLLVDLDDSISDVSQHQLAIAIVVQHGEGFLGLFRAEKGLQVLHDDVVPAGSRCEEEPQGVSKGPGLKGLILYAMLCRTRQHEERLQVLHDDVFPAGGGGQSR